MEYELESHGDTAVADMAACVKASEVLQTAYPDHPFLVGVDHAAGALHCRLMYDSAGQTGNQGYGFLLYLSTINGPDGDRRLRQAGGECLERFKLPRGSATEESAARALQNGLDLSNSITRSKY